MEVIGQQECVLRLKLLGMLKQHGMQYFELVPMGFYNRHMRAKMLKLKLLGMHKPRGLRLN